MSFPGKEFTKAEYLGYGFLAASSTELLDRVIAGDQLDEDEKHTLLRAERFLKDVSSGARFVRTGVQENVSAIDSVRKLAYSVEPLKAMHEAIFAADVGEAFEKMAITVEAVVNNTFNFNVDDAEYLLLARDFFRQLYAYLTELVEAGQRRTGINSAFIPLSASYG